MMAYKFLSAGAVGPFTGFAWPVPAEAAAGAWVSAPEGDFDRGVHACRIGDLPYWLSDELWIVELSSPVRERPTQVIALKGRLVEQVKAWDRQTALDLGFENAFRLRDLAAQVFLENGRSASAEVLRACDRIERLRDALKEALELSPSGPGVAVRMAEYADDAARHALQGTVSVGLFAAVYAAVLHQGSLDGLAAERRWQAEWMVTRLGLT
jgi:hypothetical protein